MSRASQAALAVTVLLVLVLVGSLLAGIGRGGPSTASLTLPAAEPPKGRVRVEVLNAAGVPGLARAVTRRLRDRGFDVIYFGNARGFSPDSSLILDRAHRPDAARQVSAALGIPRVLSRPDSTLYLEVTVILGRDWKQAE